MANYVSEDYYPDGKIYDIFGNYFSRREHLCWYDNMKEAIVLLNDKLGSPRLTKLTELWYSEFEDRELKKLERLLLTIRMVVDDINREGKELKVWKIQHSHLKDLLCQVDEILDDFALRAPQLREILQSPQVSRHSYLTDKLALTNNLIQELDAFIAEIKSLVLPQFYTRSNKLPAPITHANPPIVRFSPSPTPTADITPPVDIREDPRGWKKSGLAANPIIGDMSGRAANPTFDIREDSKGRNKKSGRAANPIIGYALIRPQGTHRSTLENKTVDESIFTPYDSVSSSKQDVRSKNSEEAFHDLFRSSDARTKMRDEPYNEPSSSALKKVKVTSIHSLPKHLKKCLLYTSLFPKKYEFKRDMLVQMWIAAGYVGSEGKLMEDKAGDYFNELLSMSVFQVSKLDESRFILQDDVYKLVQECGAGEYARLEDSNMNVISKETLHSSVLFQNVSDPMIFKSFRKLKGLHSLLLLHENRKCIKHIPYDLLLSLKCMRVLDLSGTQMKELPSSIGDMKALHYLDLSGTPVKSLPQSICGLSSLQSLKLRDCLNFVELPKKIKNIINLRHLELDIIRQLTCMPPKMGKLTNLQTLSAFIAGKGEGCQIAELKNLINLRGSLRIVKLENVLTVEDAEAAELYEKPYLSRLELQWSMPCLEAVDVLEGLAPHRNLTELEIVNYGGSRFPTWFGDASYSKLTNIYIYHCRNCILLPLLGRLPSLRSLHIGEMQELEKVDQKFFGGSTTEAFSKLEILEFDGMPSLEEWTGLEENGMPCLRKLTIVDCPNLVLLPELSNLKSLQHLEVSLCSKLSLLAEEKLPTSLQILIITNCPQLKQGCQEEGGEWHKIADIPTIWIDYQRIFYQKRHSDEEA